MQRLTFSFKQKYMIDLSRLTFCQEKIEKCLLIKFLNADLSREGSWSKKLKMLFTLLFFYSDVNNKFRTEFSNSVNKARTNKNSPLTFFPHTFP